MGFVLTAKATSREGQRHAKDIMVCFYERSFFLLSQTAQNSSSAVSAHVEVHLSTRTLAPSTNRTPQRGPPASVPPSHCWISEEERKAYLHHSHFPFEFIPNPLRIFLLSLIVVVGRRKLQSRCPQYSQSFAHCTRSKR